MPDEPDAALFAKFCHEILPGMLEICEVPAPNVALVAEDISLRAESVARMDRASREILAAPFYEESIAHKPDEAPAWLKAITTLVIRNSQLEEMHANGPVTGRDLVPITQFGLAPLSHLLAARRRQPRLEDMADDPFDGLPQAYPRGWACLEALRTCLDCSGGRMSYRSPGGPAPELPDASEVIDAEDAGGAEVQSDGFAVVVFSAIDPRFDQHAFQLLKTTAEGKGTLVALSSLSRISRNSRKLLRVLEFLLAYRARILTTNYLLTDKEVWVRRQELVKPDSRHPMKGWEVLSGLSGTHRKTLESWIAQVGNTQETAQ